MFLDSVAAVEVESVAAASAAVEFVAAAAVESVAAYLHRYLRRKAASFLRRKAASFHQEAFLPYLLVLNKMKRQPRMRRRLPDFLVFACEYLLTSLPFDYARTVDLLKTCGQAFYKSCMPVSYI